MRCLISLSGFISRRMTAIILLVSVLLYLSGCSTSMNSRPALQDDKNISGAVYSLPMLQFKLDITRSIVSCSPVTISTNINVSESYTSDPNATFELDYTGLASGNTVSELDISYYPNGSIKSINVESDDKSSEIINNSFSFIKGIALASAGVPAEVAPAAETQTETCNQRTINAFDQLKSSKPFLVNKTKAVAKATGEVERLTLVLATVDKPSDVLLENIRKANLNLKKAANELDILNKARLPYLALTSSHEKIMWPKTGDLLQTSQIHKPDKNLKNRWFSESVTKEEADKLLNIHTLIEPLSSSLKSNKKPTTGKGIYYRIPVESLLSICIVNICGADNSLLQKTVRTSIPQLGPVAILPFENKAFQNNYLEAKFTQLGSLSSLAFKSKKSAAEGLSKSLSKIGAELPAIRQSLLNAEIVELERSVKELEQQKLLNDARDALLPTEPSSPSPTAELDALEVLVQAETDLLLAEIALREAEIRLNELNAE